MPGNNAVVPESAPTTATPGTKRVRTVPPPPQTEQEAWVLTSHGPVMEIRPHATFDEAALQASVQHYDDLAAQTETPFSVLLDLRLPAPADAQQMLVATYFTALASSDPARAQGTAFLTTRQQACDAIPWLLHLDPPHPICTFGDEVPAAYWCLSRVLERSQMPSEQDIEAARRDAMTNSLL